MHLSHAKPSCAVASCTICDATNCPNTSCANPLAPVRLLFLIDSTYDGVLTLLVKSYTERTMRWAQLDWRHMLCWWLAL